MKFRFADKFAEFYAVYRGSPYFIGTLLGIEVVWASAHYIYGFDPDWGMLNLFLSTEASITTALLIIDLHHSDKMQHRMEIAQSKQLELQTEQLKVQSKTLGYIMRMLEALIGRPPDNEEEKHDGPQD